MDWTNPGPGYYIVKDNDMKLWVVETIYGVTWLMSKNGKVARTGGAESVWAAMRRAEEVVQG